MYTKLLFLLLGALFNGTISAAQKLYKWTDENGKVHYSDKKPKHLKSADELVIKANLPFGQNEAVEPQKLTAEQSLTHVWLYFNSQLVNLEEFENKAIGKYFFGQDCVSPIPMRAAHLQGKSNLRFAIPQSNILTKNIARFFKKFRYPVSSGSQSSLKTDLRLKPGLVLKGEVIDFKLHLCAPKKANQYFGKYKYKRSNAPEEESLKVFTRQRGMVEVKWSLMDERSEDVIYQTSFRGVSNQWKDKSDHYDGFVNGVRDATSQLLSDEKFLHYLRDYKLTKNNQESKESSFSDWFSGNINSSNYKKQAMLSKAISYLTALKVRVVEYHLMKGFWPDNNTFQTYLDNNSILLNYGIKDISISSDGSMLVDLDNDFFGNGYYFSLHPAVNNYQINWSCHSNLSKNIIRNFSCESD